MHMCNLPARQQCTLAFYSQHLKFLEASRIPNTADEVERPTRETTKWDPTRSKTAKWTSGSPSRRILPVTGYY